MIQTALLFIPVQKTPEENVELIANPDCQDSIYMTMDFYRSIGYTPPWIGYYIQTNSKLVGSAAYKGRPVDNKIEIAYGTFPAYRRQGIATEICRQLVLLALQADPGIIITARTLPELNYSAKVLQKNNFHLLGDVWDKEDGNVWEWEYKKTEAPWKT
jgi:RimJ/RimL family protein N-acetyltransferase